MLVDVTKLMIPRTCTSVHTKNKNTVETGHCTETWDDLAHFSVFNHLFVHFHSTVTVPAGQYRVKNSPAQHVGGVNEETVNLLQGARWQTCEIITSIYLNLSQDSSFQVPSSSSQLGSALTTVFSLSLTHTHTHSAMTLEASRSQFFPSYASAMWPKVAVQAPAITLSFHHPEKISGKEGKHYFFPRHLPEVSQHLRLHFIDQNVVNVATLGYKGELGKAVIWLHSSLPSLTLDSFHKGQNWYWESLLPTQNNFSRPLSRCLQWLLQLLMCVCVHAHTCTSACSLF